MSERPVYVLGLRVLNYIVRINNGEKEPVPITITELLEKVRLTDQDYYLVLKSLRFFIKLGFLTKVTKKVRGRERDAYVPTGKIEKRYEGCFFMETNGEIRIYGCKYFGDCDCKNHVDKVCRFQEDLWIDRITNEIREMNSLKTIELDKIISYIKERYGESFNERVLNRILSKLGIEPATGVE